MHKQTNKFSFTASLHHSLPTFSNHCVLVICDFFKLKSIKETQVHRRDRGFLPATVNTKAFVAQETVRQTLSDLHPQLKITLISHTTPVSRPSAAMETRIRSMPDETVVQRLNNIDDILRGLKVEYDMLFQQNRENFERIDAWLTSLPLAGRHTERVRRRLHEWRRVRDICSERVARVCARKDSLLPEWRALQDEVDRRSIWDKVTQALREQGEE